MGDPVTNTISQGSKDHGRIFLKAIYGISIGPSSILLKSLRQIPMVEREEWFNAGLKQAVYQMTIKIKAHRVDLSSPLRQNPWPAYRETVSLKIEGGHKSNVFLKSMIVIACHISGVVAHYIARRVTKMVPYGFAPAVLLISPLDLISGRRRTPYKVLWKPQACDHPLYFQVRSLPETLLEFIPLRFTK
jgi:hypothetical protein